MAPETLKFHSFCCRFVGRFLDLGLAVSECNMEGSDSHFIPMSGSGRTDTGIWKKRPSPGDRAY